MKQQFLLFVVFCIGIYRMFQFEIDRRNNQRRNLLFNVILPWSVSVSLQLPRNDVPINVFLLKTIPSRFLLLFPCRNNSVNNRVPENTNPKNWKQPLAMMEATFREGIGP